MLTETIPAYPYQEYADDENISAFFDAYNDGTQAYVDWFNEAGLAYYPSLSGDLLRWAVSGLYGVSAFSALASPVSPALGPLNSFALNTIPLNSYTAPSETYYEVTDDVLKRIVTWNFFKGDGKRFCPRWLKRRIMRFILGTNGIDPEPWNAGFTVGCENTQGVSVQFSTSYLSAPTGVSASATTGTGNLAAGTYYYVVTAENSRGETVKSAEVSATLTATGEITIDFTLPSGATGGKVYRGASAGAESVYYAISSGTATSYTDTGAAATSGSPPSVNTAVTEVLCTISLNQLVLSALTQLAPNILQIFSAAFAAPYVLEKPLEYTYVVNIATSLTAIVSPAALSETGASASESTGAATVSALGGSGSYTYAWAWLSGGSGMSIIDPAANSTPFSASFPSPQASYSADTLITTEAFPPTSSGQWIASTNIATLPGVVVIDVQTVSGGITDVLFNEANNFGNGYIFRLDTRAGYALGQILKMASGSWAEIGSRAQPVNQANVSGTHEMYISILSGGVMLLYIDGVLQCSATDTTYTPNGSMYAAYEVVGEPTISGRTTSSFDIALTGIAQCTVTDTSTGHTATAAVSVSISRVTAVSASASPSSVSAAASTETITSGQVQITASGGGVPYSYAWSWQSGGSGISINSPQTSATTFTATILNAGTEDSGTAQCVVTDIYGQQTTVTVPVTIARATQVSASISAGSLSVTGASAAESTASTTVTASGGIGPYTFAWGWQSGGAGITIGSPAAATTDFSTSALSPGTTDSGTAVCTVTDSIGQTATVTCAVSISRASLISASVSPGSQSSAGSSTTQTTGASTVSASGGSGSYSYGWTWASGGTGLTINSPYSAATSFTGSGMTLGNTYSGIAQCTVTDGYGQTAVVTVSVQIVCRDLYSGTLTAGGFTSPTVSFTGYEQGQYGTLSPATDVNGNTITLIGVSSAYGGRLMEVAIVSASQLGAGYLTTVVVNGQSISMSGASYSYNASTGQNEWSINESAFAFTINDTYPVVLLGA